MWSGVQSRLTWYGVMAELRWVSVGKKWERRDGAVPATRRNIMGRGLEMGEVLEPVRAELG